MSTNVAAATHASRHAPGGADALAGGYTPVDVGGKAAPGSLPPVTGRAPVPAATDAHASRVLADLQAYITWLAGKPGMLGEFGWPCRGNDAPEWSALGEAYLQAIDAVSPQMWGCMWGTEFGDKEIPFDTTYPGGGTFYSDNSYNRMAVYSHVPAGGSLLGPVGRLTLGAAVLEHHYSAKTTNRYGVLIDAGQRGYLGTTMHASSVTPGRSMTFNPGPTHDTSAGAGAGLSTQQTEYNYGTIVAPAGTPTTPQFLASRGVGLVRLPIKWERIQPTLGGALSTTELARIDAAVAAYAAAGIGVILDIHNYGLYFVNDTVGTAANVLGDSTVTQAMFVDLWTKMATHFVGMAGIIGYQLMNEPAFVPTVTQWITISQAAFNAIAAIDTATTIVVNLGGGGNYSATGRAAAVFPGGPWITGDTHNQARYDSHHYWDYVSSSPSSYLTSYRANVGDAVKSGFFSLRPRPGEPIGHKLIGPSGGVTPTYSTLNAWAVPAFGTPPSVTVTVPASGSVRVRLSALTALAATIASNAILAGLWGVDDGSSLTPLGSTYETCALIRATVAATAVEYKRPTVDIYLFGLTPGASQTLRWIWNLTASTPANVTSPLLEILAGNLTAYTPELKSFASMDVYAN